MSLSRITGFGGGYGGYSAVGVTALDRFVSYLEFMAYDSGSASLTLVNPGTILFPVGVGPSISPSHPDRYCDGADPITVRNRSSFPLRIYRPDSAFLGTMAADGSTVSWATFGFNGNWYMVLANGSIWTPA